MSAGLAAKGARSVLDAIDATESETFLAFESVRLRDGGFISLSARRRAASMRWVLSPRQADLIATVLRQKDASGVWSFPARFDNEREIAITLAPTGGATLSIDGVEVSLPRTPETFTNIAREARAAAHARKDGGR